MKTNGPWELARDSVLSAAQAQRLIASLRRSSATQDDAHSVAAKLDEVIVKALLFSGLRNSEFCSLRIADATLSGNEPAFVVRRRERICRTVAIPRFVGRLVREFIDEVRPALLPADISPTDDTQPLVFNERGRPFERTGLYRRVVGILRRHGLGDKASVRLLRHSYGYLAYLQTGGNLLFVQRQLGHAHPRVTAVYAKLVDESYSELAEKVGRLADLDAASPAVRRTAEFDCEID